MPLQRDFNDRQAHAGPMVFEGLRFAHAARKHNLTDIEVLEHALDIERYEKFFLYNEDSRAIQHHSSP